MPREHLVQQAVRGVLCAPGQPTRLWRNNVGGGKIGGAWVTWGLCEGSGDLIGIFSRVITQDMVGQTIGQFLSVEIKTHAKGSKPSPEQLTWLKTVNDRGGIARIIRDTGEARALLDEFRT